MDFFVDDGKGTKRFDTGRFPLTIGGRESDIQLPFILEETSSEPLARLGIASGEMFVEPEGARVSVNGTRVSGSYWLSPGDVVRVGGIALEVVEKPGALGLRVRAEEVEPVRPAPFEPIKLEKLKTPRPGPSVPFLWFVASLAILAVAAAYVFGARPVGIAIEPAPDRMDVEGTFLDFAVRGRYLLWPGTYHLVAEKAGYRKLERELEIGDDGGEFQLTFERLPGLLSVTTKPESGAEVLVDGRSVGSTPLAGIEVEAGEHEVIVRAERFREFQTRLTVEGAGSVATLDVELVSLFSMVTFVSEPPGATVRIGGKGYGPTPVEVALPEGEHGYEALLPARKPQRGRIRVVSGEPLTVAIGALSPSDGLLRLSSRPDGASVTVDGVYRGLTPIEIPLTPVAGHSLSISRPGYETETLQVEVAAGGREERSVEMTPRLGEIEVVATPPDAELFVDGEAKGAARQVLRLPAVAHRLEIRKHGFETYSIEIVPGRIFRRPSKRRSSPLPRTKK